jgi:hypothetical protein
MHLKELASVQHVSSFQATVSVVAGALADLEVSSQSEAGRQGSLIPKMKLNLWSQGSDPWQGDVSVDFRALHFVRVFCALAILLLADHQHSCVISIKDRLGQLTWQLKRLPSRRMWKCSRLHAFPMRIWLRRTDAFSFCACSQCHGKLKYLTFYFLGYANNTCLISLRRFTYTLLTLSLASATEMWCRITRFNRLWNDSHQT